jgi:hypothetical protein
MKYQFRTNRLVTIYFILSLFLFVSCGRENSQSGTDQEEMEVSNVSAESDAEAESSFNEFFDNAMGANNDVGVVGSGIFYGRPDSLVTVPRCFTTTITHPGTGFFPVRIVIDFGTTGCPGPDGRIRRGKMIIEYSDKLIHPNATATTIFDGFYVNDVHVEGTHKITNISGVIPVNLGKKYKVEVINGKLTRLNGNFIEWNSIRTILQIDGMLTPDYARDDVFKIEGSAGGVVKRNNLLIRWESNITDPLVRRFTCRWIVKGRVRTVRANLPNASTSKWAAILEFGAGACDNQAILTVNGVTRQITLP